MRFSRLYLCVYQASFSTCAKKLHKNRKRNAFCWIFNDVLNALDDLFSIVWPLVAALENFLLWTEINMDIISNRMFCFLAFSELFASTCRMKNTPNLHFLYDSHMETMAELVGDVSEIETETRQETKWWGEKTGRGSQVVVKDVYLSSNEAQEGRVNIHQPGSYLPSIHRVSPPAKNTSTAALWPELMSRDTAARSLNAVTEMNLVPSLQISVIKQNRLGRATFLIRWQKEY